MSDVKIIQHPLVECHLTVLRDKRTPPPMFRQSINRLAMLLAYSATSELDTVDEPIETPMCAISGKKLRQKIGLVPILRAGIGMVDAMLELIPNSQVWHLGCYRDETTAKPIQYYSKLKPASPVDVAFVLDPMLATGGSASMVCQILSDWGASSIKMLSIIASPEGVQRLRSNFPHVEIHACVIDEKLDENKFIIPGLGDAGDRIFNTM